MIGLVLVTHGRLADEFRAALEHVMGPQKQIEAVTIGAEDDSDHCRSDITVAGQGCRVATQVPAVSHRQTRRSLIHRPGEDCCGRIGVVTLIRHAHREGPVGQAQVRRVKV